LANVLAALPRVLSVATLQTDQVLTNIQWLATVLCDEGVVADEMLCEKWKKSKYLRTVWRSMGELL
jgi:hypothetical protein